MLMKFSDISSLPPKFQTMMEDTMVVVMTKMIIVMMIIVNRDDYYYRNGDDYRDDDIVTLAITKSKITFSCPMHRRNFSLP